MGEVFSSLTGKNEVVTETQQLQEAEESISHGEVKDSNISEIESLGFVRVSYVRIGKLSDVLDTQSDEEAYIFKGLDADGNAVKVVCPTDETCAEYKVLKKWTGEDRLRDINGCQIPVKNIEDNIYKIDGFSDNPLGFIPVPVIRKIVNSGMMSYKNGMWRVNRFGEPFFYLGLLMTVVLPYIFLISFNLVFGILLFSIYSMLAIWATDHFSREPNV